jgi:dipeptidyl-peptidase-4
MSWPVRIVMALLIAWTSATAAHADDEDPARLSLRRIFETHEFASEHASVRWLDATHGYTSLESSKRPSGGHDIVRHDPKTGATEALVAAEELIPAGRSAPLTIDDYAFSADKSRLLIFTNSQRVWRTNTRGDYWVLDRSSHELSQLARDAPRASLSYAKFAPDGLRVGYVRANNIYVEDVRDHHITSITNSASADEINGTFDWVYEEEFGLRDGFRFSPDGTMIAYWNLNTSGVREFPLVNNTDALYPRINPIKYPKVGETNAACRVGVVSITGGPTRWIETGEDPRNNYITYMEWEQDSRSLVIQQLNRHQNKVDVKRAWIAQVRIETVLSDRDDAWIDQQTQILWIHGEREFLWLSERDGWRHLYKVARGGGEPTLITPGEFDVIELLAVDHERDWIYLIASPQNPTQRYLYRVHTDGKGLERVTPDGQPGTHDYEIAPGGQWATHRFSAFDKIGTTELISVPEHKQVLALAKNDAVKSKLDALKKGRTEFFRVDIGDGVALDAWCIFPPDFQPTARYPLLVHVYGEPAGQTVLDRWGGANFLWHQMLAQHGYIVMSFDNRGTPAPRGRGWRKVVYHKIGILAPSDQAAALRSVLRDRPYIDPERIGIWGWSGGGSMSLNAIFKFPDLYTTAISVAPVSNQRYYDTIYQERYMGLPGENVEGFTQGSPINFAHQLKGNLLLIHGTGDDNCHYQATEALINELIRHNKSFSMMAYPNRSHAINEGRNTTLHLRELMTRYLRENLQPGPRSSRAPEKAATAR